MREEKESRVISPAGPTKPLPYPYRNRTFSPPFLLYVPTSYRLYRAVTFFHPIMLLHCPQQYDHHTLSPHYQSFDIRSDPHPRSPNSPLATPFLLTHRPSQHHLHSMQTPQPQSENPTVRIHQSTPSPGHGVQSNDNQSMLAQAAFLGNDWGNEGLPAAGYLDPPPRKAGGFHKRLSSVSTVSSAGPPSPHDHTSPFCRVVNSDSLHYSPLDDLDCASTPPQHQFPKSLPTPVCTPTSNTFMPPGYQNTVPSQENTRYSAPAIRRIHSAAAEDDTSSFAFSGPHSASSMSHDSPATPHTNYDAEFEDKNIARGEEFYPDMDRRMHGYLPLDLGYPQSAAFSQAMQDVFPDQVYSNPPTQNFSQQSQPNMPHTSSHLSPYRNINMFANRLQAANQDHMAQRTHSPVASGARVRSPFKPYNHMQELVDDATPGNRMVAVRPAMIRPSEASSAQKSVSPKELTLDKPETDEADTAPLFSPRFDQPSSYGERRQDANMPVFGDQNGMYNRQAFSAAPPPVPQRYPFVSGRRRPQSSVQSDPDQVPEFAPPMISMETTVEEGASEPSSSQQSSQQPSGQTQRPEDTSSDSGTYTCTYHGCTLRFETPAKLQKHKRDAHRQPSPSTGPTSAPAGPTNLGLRNSQAGPHKCQRTNPSTGKPCNSIFSRPYDLTRHEDTIHNARKPKARCHLCTDEKTFSRNDALTRHMRVVHPDVDWPGKARRGKGRV